mgnify:FL=1
MSEDGIDRLKAVFPGGVPSAYKDDGFRAYVKRRGVSMQSKQQAEAALKTYRRNSRWQPK